MSSIEPDVPDNEKSSSTGHGDGGASSEQPEAGVSPPEDHVNDLLATPGPSSARAAPFDDQPHITPVSTAPRLIVAPVVPKEHEQGLARSWQIQLRVTRALLFREVLTRYGRHNIGFLWLFVEPMFFTIGVTVLWTLTKAVHGSNLPIVAFALTGYSSVLVWRNMPSRCIGAITPNLALMYHRNVKVIDVFMSRIILEAAGATISFVILSTFFIYIGWIDPPENMLQVFWGWTLLTWFGASVALFLGALAETSEIVEKLWHPVAYLTFPISGAAFQVDALPRAMQDFMLWIPMVNCVEYIREGYFGSQVKSHFDLAYVFTLTVFITALALAQTAKTGKLVVPE